MLELRLVWGWIWYNFVSCSSAPKNQIPAHWLSNKFFSSIFAKKIVIPIMSTLSPISHWHAAYTKPRAEKKALERLTEAGFEAYLPLRRSKRKWSDRIKWVETPLFPSYIFIRVNESEYYNAISLPELVRWVSFEGKAAVIPDHQIDLIKRLLKEKKKLIVPRTHFAPGQKIIVNAGTFVGMEGELVRHNNRNKVLIRLGDSFKNLLLTVPLELLDMVE